MEKILSNLMENHIQLPLDKIENNEGKIIEKELKKLGYI